jgi:hypothetical protein
MKAEFHTPVFDVHISGLADYLGIDWDSGPDYKVSKTKMLDWHMEVFALANRLNDITFTPNRVRFDFSWWVQEEYLGEYDVLNLQKKFDVAIYKGEITGQCIIDATIENGWDIQFAQFDLHSSSGYEKEIDEIEVNLFEKTILIR